MNVIERNTKKDLECLQSMKQMSVKNSFCLHHVHYQNVAYQKVLAQPASKPDYCIYDIGSCFGREQELLEECDIIVALFQMTPWYYDLEQLRNGRRQLIMGESRVHYVGNLIAVEERRKINRLLGRVEYLEYEPQLFIPTIQAVRVFQSIVGR